MAIRNINVIENSVVAIKNEKKLQVELTQHKFQHYYDIIMSRSNDIIDVIDTFKFCVSKGLNREFADFCARGTKRIRFEDDMICFVFNNWKAENSGPYTWSVMTDGKEVYISVNKDKDNVPSMIKRTFYSEQNGYVIAPIYVLNKCSGKTYYTCHNAERPLSALESFANQLPNFIDKFFEAVDNLPK